MANTRTDMTTEPTVALEWFDSAGTCAVTVNGIDLIHFLIDPGTRAAQVTVWDRVPEDTPGSTADFDAAVLGRDVTVNLHPDTFKPNGDGMSKYARLMVWVEVEADFDEYECNKATDAEFTRAIARRILSGDVEANVVKCSTVLEATPDDEEVTA